MFQCRACLNEVESKRFLAKEMMFGTKEEFEYVECAECGSIQIDHIPSPDLITKHYPEDYYSFGIRNADKAVFLKSLLKTLRARHVLGRPNLLGALLVKLRPVPPFLDLLRQAGVKSSPHILDVGCGSGEFLDELASNGFQRLLGVDPFVEREIITPRGVKILKATLGDVPGQFDVIMFHHSLEHVPDAAGTLNLVHKKLLPKGICIVRIPTTSSEAWDHYGKDWVQLDAPRHFFVPSRKGMAIIGRRSGLVLEKTIDDSWGFQFWGSEQYQRGIPLRRTGLSEPIFSKSELAEYERRASEVNARGRGDQAAFIFRRGS